MSCRICRSPDLREFLDLGEQPPANALLASPEAPESFFPLGLALCPSCRHVQLTHTVPAPLLFSDYRYFSSVSQHMTEHFAALADEAAARFVPEGGLVVEIGSNDGILLQRLVGRVRVLGVDPADTCAVKARERGVTTVVDFFDTRVAREIVAAHGHADVVVGANVLGHVHDLHETIQAVELLLAPEGVAIFEMPYLADLFENFEFDTVYHEHVSYFCLHPLKQLLATYGLGLFEARRMSVHGGSIRVFARRGTFEPIPLEVAEEGLQLHSEDSLARFTRGVERVRTDLRALVASLREQGRKVVGYTAPAKGNVLLNYCQLELPYLADATPSKQGLYSPGTHIPIVSPEAFRQDAPDCALLLAWNHRQEVCAREQAWRDGGGRFILPLPEVCLV